MILIKEASVSHIKIIQDLAEKTWWDTYSTILSKEQIQYMLSEMYSEKALKKNIELQNQTFLILYSDTIAKGFAGYGITDETNSLAKLYKLYVDPADKGKGYGKQLVYEVKQRLKSSGIHLLELNVNRYNPAKAFYKKLGFEVIAEEDIAIGNFWMNDYIMRTTLW